MQVQQLQTSVLGAPIFIRDQLFGVALHTTISGHLH